MTDITEYETGATAHNVLSGLVPTQRYDDPQRAKHSLPRESAFAKNLFATVPIVLVGSMAMSMNLTGPVSPVEAKPSPKPKTETSNLGQGLRSTATAAATPTVAAVSTPVAKAAIAVPKTYKVKGGDTVSSIAVAYGLSTASVLALNGLSWKSIIYPNQVLQLSKTGTSVTTPAAATPAAAATSTVKKHTVVKGDTLSGIAKKYAVTLAAILSANNLKVTNIIYPGQKLTVPTKSTTTKPPVTETPTTETPTTGTPTTSAKSHVVKSGDTLSAIAKKYSVTLAALVSANKIKTTTIIYPGQKLVIPGKTTTTTPPVETETPVVDKPSTVNGTHVIKSGDTLSAIAKKYGITLTALLNANGLKSTSIIYAGRTLIIPGVVTTTPAGTGGTVTLLSGAQETNAKTIISVGRSLGVSDYGIIIALATAMQESTMRNIDYGDLDSVGLFQQRPSSGWGTVAQLTTPSHAAKLFYGGPSNPNKGKTRGLLDISGWEKLTVTQAAQKVQISAHPDAYAKWEASARFWLKDLG